MPADQARDARDATLDVLGLLESDEELPTTTANPVQTFLQDNSIVDCSSATVPLKPQKKKKKKNKRKSKSGRRWVYKYSSVCAGRSGQFRWPDDCHQYVDCWRGRGRSSL